MSSKKAKIKKEKRSNRTAMSNITIAIYVITFLFFGASIYMELKTTESFCSNYFNINCPVFLQAPAIFEIIKVVGFSNIIVAWIYVNSDKKMLGLSYLDILNATFPCHGVFSIIHFASTLICIAVSSSGLSESSIITLIIVLWGLIYQFYVFYCIILNPKKCEQLAHKVWHKHNKNFVTTQDKLLCIAGTFPRNDSKQYRAHLACFASLFIEETISSFDDNCVKHSFHIWDKLLSDNHLSLNSIVDICMELFHQVFVKYPTEEENAVDGFNTQNKCLCALMNGYLSYLVIKMKQETVLHDCLEEKYWSMIKDIETIIQSLYEKADTKHYDSIFEISNCIQTNIYLIAWLLFQEGKMNFTKQISEINPLTPNHIFFDEISNIIFPEYIKKPELLERAKDIAKSQLNAKTT